MEKIVVLGGSFNPPTIGHYLLMKSAMKSVNADKGIFLPTSQQYVRRKMASNDCENQTMPDELRLAMLRVMLSTHLRRRYGVLSIPKAIQRVRYQSR